MSNAVEIYTTNKQRTINLFSLLCKSEALFLKIAFRYQKHTIKTNTFFLYNLGKIIQNTGIASGITVTEIVSLSTVGWMMKRKTKQPWLPTALDRMEVKEKLNNQGEFTIDTSISCFSLFRMNRIIFAPIPHRTYLEHLYRGR